MNHCKDCERHLQRIAVLETKIKMQEDGFLDDTLPRNLLAADKQTQDGKPIRRTVSTNTGLLSPPDANKNKLLVNTTRRMNEENILPLNLPSRGQTFYEKIGTKPKNRCPLLENANTSSTPIEDANAWTVVKRRKNGRIKVKTVSFENETLPLDNRFLPLLSQPDWPSDKAISPATTVFIGTSSIQDTHRMAGNEIKSYCFPNKSILDIPKEIPDIMTSNKSMSKIILQVAQRDIHKQNSEILKRDFTELLRTISSLDCEVYISGPLPSINMNSEKFSRTLALNTWLTSACMQNNVNFIDHFDIFWKRTDLFREDGFHLSRAGETALTLNIHNALRHPIFTINSTPQNTMSSIAQLTPSAVSSITVNIDKDKIPLVAACDTAQRSTPLSDQQSREDQESREMEPINDDDTSESSDFAFELSPPPSPLAFTQRMNQLVYAGLKLTPSLASPGFSSPVPPRRSKRAVPPPAPSKRPFPPPPPSRPHALSPY